MSGWQPPPSFVEEPETPPSKKKNDISSTDGEGSSRRTKHDKSSDRSSSTRSKSPKMPKSPKRSGGPSSPKPSKPSKPSSVSSSQGSPGSGSAKPKKGRSSAAWAPTFVVADHSESSERGDDDTQPASAIGDGVSMDRGAPTLTTTSSPSQFDLTERALPPAVRGGGVISTSRPVMPPRSMTPPKPAMKHQPSHSAMKSPTRVSPTPAAKKAGVNWNQTLFVADQVGSDKPSAQVEEGPPRSSATAPRPPPRRGFGSLKRHVSRKDTFIIDQEILDTRLEWTQQLVSESFKPYKKMICDMDDDLPDIDDIVFDQDDYFDEDHEMREVRDEMLDDPKITEREIAAFFEGYKLFQTKANSLQAQLDAVKSIQKNQHKSQVMSTRQLQLSHDTKMASERILSIKQRTLMARGGSVPAITTEKSSSIPEDNPAPLRSPLLPKQADGDKEEKVQPPAPVAIDKKNADNNTHTAKAEEPVPTEKAKVEEPKEKPKSDEKKDRRGLMMSGSLRALSIKRIKESTSDEGSSDIHKLLEELEEAERRQKKLEKQLAQAGVVIAEDIPYDVAKAKVESIAKRMGEIGGSDNPEYFELEKDMEKYTAALMMTDEYQEEQEEVERQWEKSVEKGNLEAVKKVRRHMPVEVRNMSENALATNPTPNGKRLPKDIAKKFKRTNVLQLLRIDPKEIAPMHPSTLENMRVTGMTLTERRAMYHHLKDLGPRWKAMQSDKMTERKWIWYTMMKSNFKENVDAWQRHVDEYGPPGNHPYATRQDPNAGCPLIGKQCPLKADMQVDYNGDYGYPEEAEYFKTATKSKDNGGGADDEKQRELEAAREQKSLERSGALKKHYKGKILQVSLASGSCENMDEAMDKIEAAQEKSIRKCLESKGGETDDDSKKKEVVSFTESLNEFKLSILQFAERSGMQLTGKRDANADEPDIRSMIELALCEEVIELGLAFFILIEQRLQELSVSDGRMRSTIAQLRELLDELHDRNLKSIENLDGERPPRSRPLKGKEEVMKEVQKEIDAKEDEERKKAAAAAEAEAGKFVDVTFHMF